MPGRLIQAIRRAGVNNPVLMLDEIDKLGRDYRGDPTAALLEVLDPAQNSTFRDNYLDLPFDLSKVFFVATANALDVIPPALLDRMEVLWLSGYSEEEKLQIAVRYLVPAATYAGGSDADSAHDHRGGRPPDHLGLHPRGRRSRARANARPGRAQGRAGRSLRARPNRSWSSRRTSTRCSGRNGFSSSRRARSSSPAWPRGLPGRRPAAMCSMSRPVCLPGMRGLRLTGQLGDVMRRVSAGGPDLCLVARGEAGRQPARGFVEAGLHIHVPAGAVPKDGPSAGVTMATAVTSLYTGLPVRSHTAMTGEITLTGLVLPVGGIKEKVLAAHRAGIRRVILPKANEKDLRELPESVRARHGIYPGRADRERARGGHSRAGFPAGRDAGGVEPLRPVWKLGFFTEVGGDHAGPLTIKLRAATGPRLHGLYSPARERRTWAMHVLNTYVKLFMS